MAGRPRKPAELKREEGNRSKRSLPDPDHLPDAVAPDPPSLHERAFKKWNEVVPQLEKMRVLTKSDRDSLTLYCQTWAEYEELLEDIQANGRTYTVETQYSVQTKVRPEVSLLHSARVYLLKVQTEFGLTPSSRAGLFSMPEEDTGLQGLSKSKPEPKARKTDAA